MASIVGLIGPLIFISGLAYLGYSYFYGKWPFDGSIMFPMKMDMTCPTGMHWDTTMSKCVADPAMMTCTPMTCATGMHWDMAMCKCVADSVMMPKCYTGSHVDTATNKCVWDTGSPNLGSNVVSIPQQMLPDGTIIPAYGSGAAYAYATKIHKGKHGWR